MHRTRIALAAAGAALLALIPAAAASAASFGPYQTLGSPSLNERTSPSTSAPIVGSLPYHSTIYIKCQTSGSLVGSSYIWDQLTNGAYISDYWTNTPGQDTWTASITRCGTTSQTGAVGRTVSYNEGASGECTWWAINEFHAYTGYYPNFVAPGNNGDAQYWAANAAYNGWTVTATPRTNAIAVFPPWKNGAGSVGHVAWVTAVSGAQITMSEMNFVKWNTVDARTVTPDATVRYILAP
jgi:surface antigen